MQGDEVSSIVSLHSQLSDYTQTWNEDMEEDGKPAGGPEKGMTALQKVHQDLMIQVDGFKDLISVAEGMDVSDFPMVLPILGSVTGVVSITPSGSAEGERTPTKHRLPRNLKPQAPYNSEAVLSA